MAVRRYQDCPWHVRLWRRRYYLPVPFHAVSNWLALRRQPPDGRGWRPAASAWELAWQAAIGYAQIRMEWWHTMDEIETLLRLRKVKP
jgi:hypothetical protein